MRPTRPHKSEFQPSHSLISQGDDWHYPVGNTQSHGSAIRFHLDI